jgi:tRNA(Ile)-lysidine synthase
MNIIQSTLLKFLADFPEQPILIAYSGGVDSQVLLDSLTALKQLNKIQNPLHVCHVNHGLSNNAEQWQRFAQQQCQLRQVELTTCAVNIERKNQQSLEALARDARYLALQNTATKLALNKVLIITGHHQDDQCETFLLALKRGAGLKGLSAMNSVMPLGKHLLARPLLNCSRANIEHYAHEQQLTWIEDESNADTNFDRNFLRQEIIPLLKKRWPSITTTVSRSSDFCRDSQTLLDNLAQQDLQRCGLNSDDLLNQQQSEPALIVAELVQLTRIRFNNLLRYFIAEQGCLMPSSAQLQQVQQQLIAPADKSPHVNLGEYSFRRYRGGLYLTQNFADVQRYIASFDATILRSAKEQTIELPDGLGKVKLCLLLGAVSSLSPDQKRIEKTNQDNVTLLLAPKNAEKVTISFSHNNAKCLPDYRQHSRSLKKILQELNIKPWQRKRIPFVYYDDILVAALGYFVCQDFVTKESEKAQPVIKINWLK